MWIRSLARHNGLRIQHCCSCGLGRNYGLDLIPGLETPYATGRPKKEKDKKHEPFRQLLVIFSRGAWKGRIEWGI